MGKRRILICRIFLLLVGEVKESGWGGGVFRGLAVVVVVVVLSSMPNVAFSVGIPSFTLNFY